MATLINRQKKRDPVIRQGQPGSPRTVIVPSFLPTVRGKGRRIKRSQVAPAVNLQAFLTVPRAVASMERRGRAGPGK
ncbi:MAG: hypothetical protein LBR80_16465 [Deltaproteobacteria bacterium]|nr:hypothetical protein [Deltaproteobacteria bacterium]